MSYVRPEQLMSGKDWWRVWGATSPGSKGFGGRRPANLGFQGAKPPGKAGGFGGPQAPQLGRDMTVPKFKNTTHSQGTKFSGIISVTVVLI